MECLSTPCQFCARLCASDCSKSGLVVGLNRIICAHNFHVTINFFPWFTIRVLKETTSKLFFSHLLTYKVYLSGVINTDALRLTRVEISPRVDFNPGRRNCTNVPVLLCISRARFEWQYRGKFRAKVFT